MSASPLHRLRPAHAGALLAALTLAACGGAPDSYNADPLAGAALSEPDFGPPELLGGPEIATAPNQQYAYTDPVPWTSEPRPFASTVPPPPPVGNSTLDLPPPSVATTPSGPALPGGPVRPEPYGLAGGPSPQPSAPPALAEADRMERLARADAFAVAPPSPPLGRVAGRVQPPGRELAGPPPGAPMQQQYASADVIGRPALPRPYGSRVAPPTLTDAPPAGGRLSPYGSPLPRARAEGLGAPAPAAGPPPMVIAMAPIPDAEERARASAAPVQMAAAPHSEVASASVTGPSANAPTAVDLPVAAPTAPPAVTPEAPRSTATASPASVTSRIAPTPRPRTTARAEQPAARTPITDATTEAASETATAEATPPAAQPAQGGPSARVWWALGLLAAGLLAVVALLSRSGRKTA